MKAFWKMAAVRTVGLIVACVLPLNIFVLVDAIRMTDEVKTQVGLSTQNVADAYINTLDNIMENTDYLLYDLTTNNSDMLRLFQQKGDSDYANARYRSFYKMRELTQLRSEGDGLFVYLMDTEDIVLVTNSTYSKHQEALAGFFSDAANRTLTRRWHIEEIDGMRWLTRIVLRKNAYYGAVINLDAHLENLMNDLTYETGRAWFSGDIDEAAAKATTGSSENTAAGTLTDSAMIPSAGSAAAVRIRSLSDKGDLALNIEIPESEILSHLSYTRKGALLLAIIFIFIIPLLYTFMRKMLLTPVKCLNEAHHQLQTNPDYRIEDHANTVEMESAYDSFNEMADNIQKLKIENMEKELAKNKMELSNLQLQIRPHFLLNTFNLIYILSERKNYTAIRELILYLSDYFSYIYRSGKEVELFDKELHLIEGYIKAASIRYPGLVHIIYQIDPEVHLMRVPPLLIHNFIENSINHGMIQDTPLHITLFAGYDDGVVTFQISDDGQGMDSRTVLEINEDRYTGDGGRVHVGLRNSIQRLRYFYGAEAVLHVDSTLGEGTVFTITIPYNLEDDNDEAVDGQ